MVIFFGSHLLFRMDPVKANLNTLNISHNILRHNINGEKIDS